jgi:hypothetical protein
MEEKLLLTKFSFGRKSGKQLDAQIATAKELQMETAQEASLARDIDGLCR